VQAKVAEFNISRRGQANVSGREVWTMSIYIGCLTELVSLFTEFL
jgi:hypothetical protein